MKIEKTELEAIEKDWTGLNNEKSRIVEKLVRAKNPSQVLDIGVFTGVFWVKYYPELLKSGGVYGVDLIDEYLAISSDRGIHTTKCNVDTEPLPYPDNSFDFVLCEGLLEHTLRPKQLFSEIHRVLRPGGSVLISVPNATNITTRWRMLRGDSPFHPMIDNLFTKDFQKRCAVLYSPPDLRWALSQFFTVDTTQIINRLSHDPKTVTIKLFRLISRYVPSLRDMLIVTATKSDTKTS